MKTAAIISIGSEIMCGKIDDTNSTQLCKWLRDCGISAKFRLSTRDIIEDIVEALDHVTGRSDVIILTGGLGPTNDDLTREALAAFLGRKLIFDEKQYGRVLSFFKRYNIPAPSSNRKQAELIEGAEFLENENGTAPGMFCQVSDLGGAQAGVKTFILLPGPPRENQPMLNKVLFPKLKEKGLLEGEIHTRVFRIYNVGESVIADVFSVFKEDVDVGYYVVSGGWCEIHLSKYVTSRDEIKKLAPIYRKAEKILDAAGIFHTENKDLSLLVLEALQKKGKTLAFAESITGGNLSGEFVKNSGASKVFLGGVVAYSNDVKKKLLGVKQATLKKHGAVSDETAAEMVVGLKKLMKADICVSITGIAGPEGGTKTKPVGLVHFAFMFGNKVHTKKEVIPGIRARVMVRAVNMVFVEILKNLGAQTK